MSVYWKSSTFPLVATLIVALTGAGVATATTGQAPAVRLDHALETHFIQDNSSAKVIVRLDGGENGNGRSPEFLSKATSGFLQPILERLKEAQGVTNLRPLRLQRSFAANLTARGLEEVLSLPGVLSIEIDNEWTLHTAEGMEMIGASELQTYGFSGAGSAIAIIDTGIDPLHPALGGGEIPNPKVVRGLDTADGDDDPSDCSGHGTAVASIAAGVSFQWSPGRRFAGGVAPEARILAYKAVSDDECWAMRESAVIAAIEDAILHREGENYTLAAINISGGGGSWPGPCDIDNPALSAAVNAATSAGIAVVASTGNEGLTDGVASPACIENVLAVGSVWDQNPSTTGSLFCLNADCTRYCNDDAKSAGQPTCYSNSGLMVDLLAPSEYLLVAEAGGQTTAFGGTSGAAPYVAGGIALLKHAHPDAPPAHMRHLLRASGTLLTDGYNHRTLPMIDLVSAVSPHGLFLGDGVDEGLLSLENGPLVSQAIVDSWGPIGSLELALRITHPNPEDLRIRVRSPLGNEVLVFNDRSTSGSARSLIGTVPIDMASIESLNAFIGSERHGAWELIIEDHMVEPHQAQLESWSLRVNDLYPPSQARSPNVTYLPVAARGPGEAGTRWTTDLQIFNPSPYTPAQGTLFLVREDTNGTEEHIQRPLFIPAEAQIDLKDVIGDTFGLASGAGQILIDTSNQPVIAGATIATRGESGGRFGQFENGVKTAGSTRLVIPHISGGPNFRTNIGLSENSGSVAQATLTLYEMSLGKSIGSPIELEIQPFSIKRIGEILSAASVAETMEEAYAIVETSDIISVWASVVDQDTGDATFILGTGPISETPVLIPVVARTSGVGGTLWRSDVHIVAIGSGTANIQLEFRPADLPEEPPMIADITIEGGSGAVLKDIVGLVFGSQDTAGSLRIVPVGDSPPLAVSSRTYNQGQQGTYGQSIPAVTVGTRASATVIGIEGSDDHRSNLILAETQGAPVIVEATLFDQHGNQLGTSIDIEIEPFGLVQVNDVFATFATPARENCRVEVLRTGGEGSFFALASVVDSHTGDAIAIPMAVAE